MIFEVEAKVDANNFPFSSNFSGLRRTVSLTQFAPLWVKSQN